MSTEPKSPESFIQADGPANEDPPPSIGTRLGSYILVRELGRGGMGVVYEARHESASSRVAVKILGSSRVHSEESRRRFLREAQACSRIDHPGLTKIFGFGETDEHLPYILMEYLDGQTWRTCLKASSSTALSLERIVNYAHQVAVAIAAAHRAGVIHRDLKPDNTMLMRDSALPGGWRIKVLDFGIAKILGVQNNDTLANGVGTPSYMAPEQCLAGTPNDEKVDVYALGIILFESLCGEPPFVGEAVHILHQHVYQSPPAYRLKTLRVPPALAALTLRALRKMPGKRPSMEEMAQELARIKLEPQPGEHRVRRSVLMALLLTCAGGLTGIVARLGYERGWELHVRRFFGEAWTMVKFTGGSFQMGSTPQEVESAFEWAKRSGCPTCPRSIYLRELPRRTVMVSPFLLDRTEVTNADFASWMNELAANQTLTRDGASRQVSRKGILYTDMYPDPAYGGVAYEHNRYLARKGMEQMPVTQVTWDAAHDYCQAHGKRLPTEAEWEFAAGNGENTRFPWGDNEPSCEKVVFDRNPKHAGRCQHLPRGPAKVAGSPQDRTATGVYDLGGNVAEWLEDVFRSSYEPCIGSCRNLVVLSSATADPGPEQRVIRGGSWYRTIDATRSAGRSRDKRNTIMGDVGFRCAKTAR